MRIINHQSGVALLSALLIMVFCALLATFFLLNSRLLLEQANLVKGNDVLQTALQGVQDWAMETVSANPNLHKITDLQRDLNGVKIHGTIVALGGRFNLNSLQQTANIPRFVTLLQTVDHTLSTQAATNLALSLSQWQHYKTSDENYYLTRYPAYRSSHQRLISVSELRLVRGINAKLYRELLPYITALPTSYYQVNVNYASAPVFMTLANLSLSQAQYLVQCRARRYFQSVEDFMLQCGLNLKTEQDQLTVENPYYLVVASAEHGEQNEVMRTLLKLQKNEVTVVWQALGDE